MPDHEDVRTAPLRVDTVDPTTTGPGPTPGPTPDEPTPARRRRLRADYATYALVAIVVLYLSSTPIVFLVRSALFADGTFSARAFLAAFGDPELPRLLGTTAALASGVVVVSVVLGTALAYLYVRTDVPLKGLLFAASILPLAIPAVIYAICWVFLLSPRTGLLNVLSSSWGGPVYDVFGLGGMILVGGLNSVPVVFLLMYAAFRAADPSLEESAIMSGASRFQVFLRVTLPLTRPALAAVVLLQLVRGLEAFEVPAVIGVPAGDLVITSRIYLAADRFPIDYGGIGALSTVLIVVIAAGLYLLVARGRMGRGAETVGGKGFRPRLLALGPWRLPAALLVALFFLFAVALPVLILGYASLQPAYAAPSLERLGDLSLANYADVLGGRGVARSAGNTLLVAAASATATTVIAALASWMIVRARLRRAVSAGLEALIWLPMAIPGVVMGMALLVLYVSFPIPVYGTLWLLLIAYVTLFLPLAFQYVNGSVYQISRELEEAASMSGAAWSQMFVRIIVPLLLPGLLASWLFVFINAARELGSSVLLYSPRSEVLAVGLFRLYQQGEFGQVAALGMLMISALLVVAAVLRAVENRFSAYSSR